MPKYTYDLTETRQYRLTVEAPDEADAFEIVQENYYEGFYNEALEQHPCGMEIYRVKDGQEEK